MEDGITDLFWCKRIEICTFFIMCIFKNFLKTSHKQIESDYWQETSKRSISQGVTLEPKETRQLEGGIEGGRLLLRRVY